MGCTQAAHGQDCTEPGWDGLGGGSEGGRERGRLRPDAGRRNQSLPWRSARSRRTRGTQRNRGRPPGERRGPSRRAGPRRPGRSHGRIAHAGASPSTTSWTVGGSRPEPGWAWSRAPDLLWLRSSTRWLPSAGIEQVLRTRSRSWPITRDTTGPAHPPRGGVGCRCASGSRSGRRGALRFCSSGVMAGRASSSSSSARARRSSGIRPCGAQCSPPPRDGPQARAPGWPAGTPAWRGSHEWSSAGARRRIAHAVGSRFGAAEVVAYHTRVHFGWNVTHMRRVGRYAGCVGVYDGGGAMRSGARCAGPLPNRDRHVTTVHGDRR